MKGSLVCALSVLSLLGVCETQAYAKTDGWAQEDEYWYWYENGVKQGTTKDPKGVKGENTVRGREIYDFDSKAWYWLDADHDGAKAVDKEVWVPYVYQEEEPGSTKGKWVRYDEEGHMIKGWHNAKDKTYYYDLQTGAMYKGRCEVEGHVYSFDDITGVLLQAGYWVQESGNDYWYEKGKKMGLEGRGKEIYDPSSDGWYWLDAIDGGKKAVSKDVYQESNDGKWVRYDADGRMVKGWNRLNENDYYFDLLTGAMAKGTVQVDGIAYVFDEITGICLGRAFHEDEKTIYLTFDDGPGAYTDQLLDVLKRYNVKATFFTTSGYPGYAYCIHREYEEGHAVAVHTASHNYATIYRSEDAYWADFNRQNEVIFQQTGQYATMFRFPGGSSNTVSRNYNRGIMSRLAQQAADKGYVYYDWNVSSGDAGGTTNADQVYRNVINGIAGNSRRGVSSVVLQHDIKNYSVNAVESIIRWGLDNGYNFQPLSRESNKAHHSIAN